MGKPSQIERHLLKTDITAEKFGMDEETIYRVGRPLSYRYKKRNGC
jgi:hypothetical protein